MNNRFQTVVRLLLVLALAIAPLRGVYAGLIELENSISYMNHQMTMADANAGDSDMQMNHDCCKQTCHSDCNGGCQSAGASCHSCVTGHAPILETALLSLDHFHDPVPPLVSRIWRVQFPDPLDRPPLSLI